MNIKEKFLIRKIEKALNIKLSKSQAMYILGYDPSSIRYSIQLSSNLNLYNALRLCLSNGYSIEYVMPFDAFGYANEISYTLKSVYEILKCKGIRVRDIKFCRCEKVWETSKCNRINYFDSVMYIDDTANAFKGSPTGYILGVKGHRKNDIIWHDGINRIIKPNSMIVICHCNNSYKLPEDCLLCKVGRRD